MAIALCRRLYFALVIIALIEARQAAAVNAPTLPDQPLPLRELDTAVCPPPAEGSCPHPFPEWSEQNTAEGGGERASADEGEAKGGLAVPGEPCASGEERVPLDLGPESDQSLARPPSPKSSSKPSLPALDPDHYTLIEVGTPGMPSGLSFSLQDLWQEDATSNYPKSASVPIHVPFSSSSTWAPYRSEFPLLPGYKPFPGTRQSLQSKSRPDPSTLWPTQPTFFQEAKRWRRREVAAVLSEGVASALLDEDVTAGERPRLFKLGLSRHTPRRTRPAGEEVRPRETYERLWPSSGIWSTTPTDGQAAPPWGPIDRT